MSPGFSDGSATSGTKSQEVSFCVRLLKRLSLSIHEGLLSRPLIQCVSVWACRLKCFCQCEVKRVARVVKASCLLMSRPAEWMRTQMGFLSGGPSLSVFGETWKPQLEWTGILLNEGRLEAFTQHGLNRMWETGSESCVWGCGGLLRWGQYNVNGPCCHQLLSPLTLGIKTCF